MAVDPESMRALMAKIDALSAERVAEVEDFVEFLRLRDQARSAVTRASQATFASVWNNPDDAAYDAL